LCRVFQIPRVFGQMRAKVGGTGSAVMQVRLLTTHRQITRKCRVHRLHTGSRCLSLDKQNPSMSASTDACLVTLTYGLIQWHHVCHVHQCVMLVILLQIA